MQATICNPCIDTLKGYLQFLSTHSRDMKNNKPIQLNTQYLLLPGSAALRGIWVRNLGPLHTVPRTAFPRPRQRTASSALLLSPFTLHLESPIICLVSSNKKD